jgi:glycosyltransferase involved in cell wall biosynthesis
MKILLLTQWYPPEPALLIEELAQTLIAYGHQVQVLTGFPNYPGGKLYHGYRLRLLQRETVAGVPVARVPLYPEHSLSGFKRSMNYFSFAAAAAALGWAAVSKPDVMFVYHPPLTIGFPAFVLSRFWRIPFVYHIADMWPETLSATGMVNNAAVLKNLGRFATWIYKKSAAISVITPGFRDNLVSKGVPADKIHVISSWVDTNFFRPVESDAVLAQKLGLAGRFNVMYTGTIGLAQGLDTVLEAAILLKDIPKVQFILVGDGADCQRLQGLAAERQIHNILFLGRHPATEMPRFYALADVLFLHLKDDPLFRITIPHKIFAYLASGLPILAAIEGDASKVVYDAQAGVICKPGDAKEIADAVRKLYLLSPAERTSLGMNGRKAAVELYSRENLVAQIEQMIIGAAQKNISTTRGQV